MISNQPVRGSMQWSSRLNSQKVVQHSLIPDSFMGTCQLTPFAKPQLNTGSTADQLFVAETTATHPALLQAIALMGGHSEMQLASDQTNLTSNKTSESPARSRALLRPNASKAVTTSDCANAESWVIAATNDR